MPELNPSSDAENSTPNPFRSPSEFHPSGENGSSHGGRYVRRVPIIAVLLAVHGALLLLAGIGMLSVMGLFLVDPGVAEEAGPVAKNMLVGIYTVFGLLTFTLGILQIVAGVRNFYFRGRVLGIIALSSGIVLIFTFYCALTGVPLAIWGLITYLNPTVERAFQLGSAGRAREDVLAAFHAE